MLHEASHREPEAVAERVLVDQQVTATLHTRVRVVPLIGCQSGKEHDNGVRERRGAAIETPTAADEPD